MTPQVEAAWIALIGVGLGVGGTVTVAVSSFRSTLTSVREQIEADRRSRIWEKRAELYTDSIAAVRDLRTIRDNRLARDILGQTTRQSPAVPDFRALEARLFAYASTEVINALEEVVDADKEWRSRLSEYSATKDQAQRLDWRASAPDPSAERDRAVTASVEATRLGDALLDMIRDELHAGTGRSPLPPVPQSRPVPDHAE